MVCTISICIEKTIISAFFFFCLSLQTTKLSFEVWTSSFLFTKLPKPNWHWWYHLSETLPMKIEMSSSRNVYDICKYPKKVLSKSDICFHVYPVQGIQNKNKLYGSGNQKCKKLKSMSPFWGQSQIEQNSAAWRARMAVIVSW